MDVNNNPPILHHFSFRLGTIKVGIKPTPWEPWEPDSSQGFRGGFHPGGNPQVDSIPLSENWGGGGGGRSCFFGDPLARKKSTIWGDPIAWWSWIPGGMPPVLGDPFGSISAGFQWSTDLQKLMKFIKASNDDKKWKIHTVSLSLQFLSLLH